MYLKPRFHIENSDVKKPRSFFKNHQALTLRIWPGGKKYSGYLNLAAKEKTTSLSTWRDCSTRRFFENL